MSVAAWYSSLGYSFLPIAVFTLGLPLIIGNSRVAAARRGRLEYGLLHHPFRPELAPHRLQLANVVLFCIVVALTVPAGAYGTVAIRLPGVYPVLLVLFFAGLAVLVLIALLPLRRVRVGSNLLVAAGTIFLVTQLVMLYRPPVDAVTIGSTSTSPQPPGPGWTSSRSGSPSSNGRPSTAAASPPSAIS